jgi:hypothetical protein
MSREEVCEIFKAYCASSQIIIEDKGKMMRRFNGEMRTYQAYNFSSELEAMSSIGFNPIFVLLDGVFLDGGTKENIEIIFRNRGTNTSKEVTSLGNFRAILPTLLQGKKPDVKLPVDNAEFQLRVVQLLEEIVRKLDRPDPIYSRRNSTTRRRSGLAKLRMSCRITAASACACRDSGAQM